MQCCRFRQIKIHLSRHGACAPEPSDGRKSVSDRAFVSSESGREHGHGAEEPAELEFRAKAWLIDRGPAKVPGTYGTGGTSAKTLPQPTMRSSPGCERKASGTIGSLCSDIGTDDFERRDPELRGPFLIPTLQDPMRRETKAPVAVKRWKTAVRGPGARQTVNS